MNRKGQFSIIAALLVAIVLIATVVATYSTIRNNTIRDQPPIQSAIDETNLAIKQILGFTVGYYGSVLKSTGNSTYAKDLATEYLHSGLVYTANMHPEWGTSFDVSDSELSVYWYANTSYSSGSLSVSYNLTGLGITGITYDTSCSLLAHVMPTINDQAQLNITKDGTEPLVNLGKSNFNFYRYDSAISKWNLVNPPSEPLVFSNGTYQIDIPSGIDVNSYLIQIEDQRGIIVLASSYSSYSINLVWNATTPPTQHYVDNDSSDIDMSPDRGTHANFTAMKYGPDGVMDTLTEAVTAPAIPERWVNFSFDESSAWMDRPKSYDNLTGTRAYVSISPNGWSDYLTLSRSNISSHYVRFWIGRSSSSHVKRVQIDVFNGAWINVYNINSGGTWDDWAYLNFTEMSVMKMRIRFYNGDNSNSYSAYVYEASLLQSGTQQNCELDLEAQWTNLSTNVTNQWLCIYGGTMGSEDIRVDVRNGSSWKNLFTDLTSGWNNISIYQYIDSPTFTIRFKGATESFDPVQHSWQIDTALVRSAGFGSSGGGDTVVFELLQNGTMRWLGQNLELSTQSKPIPPVPVRSIQVKQTVNNITSEVPFQLEDWASDYRIPLGLTSNESVFSDRTMLVFLAASDVSKVTIWWNGSDVAVQTRYAYTNLYFKDNAVAGTLNNSKLLLRFQSGFQVNASTLNGSISSFTSYMRINSKDSIYGSGLSYVIVNGSVRDIVQQEAEFSGGIPNCPNVYAHIVLTLPANVAYYTYQLRLMFIQSQQNRTIADLCPIKLTTSTGQPQTENGTLAGIPIVMNTTDLFYNSSASYWMHHWSQFVSGSKGAGIMFTDQANQGLYVFDNIAGRPTGALRVSNSGGPTIELLPVTIASVSFKYALDVTWCGAVATFDGTTPIYKDDGTIVTGLWLIVEQLPTATVITEG